MQCFSYFHFVMQSQGIGDSATSEAKALPLFDSSLLIQMKIYRSCVISIAKYIFNTYMKIVFKRNCHTH